MIWGCQYDAMMRWMEIIDSSSIPGYNESLNPGKESADRIKNVYDLYGSTYEWTQEARDTKYRGLRGGLYGYGGSPSIRSGNAPVSSANNYGCRLALYIEL